MGILKNISVKNKGLLIDEKWHTCTERVMKFVSMKGNVKGMTVDDFEEDDKGIITKITLSGQGQPSGFKPGNKIRSMPNDEERVRSMSLAYSKDLVVAKAVKLDKMFDTADLIANYIKTGVKPGDAVEQEIPEEVVE